MTQFAPRDGSGLGGPGIWDPMPLVPPKMPADEVDDANLIWSKPRMSVQAAGAGAKPKSAQPQQKRSKKGKRKSAKRKTTKKKTAGRQRKRR